MECLHLLKMHHYQEIKRLRAREAVSVLTHHGLCYFAMTCIRYNSEESPWLIVEFFLLRMVSSQAAHL